MNQSFFLKQRDDLLSTLQGGYIVVTLYICICNVNEYFLQGETAEGIATMMLEVSICLSIMNHRRTI